MLHSLKPGGALIIQGYTPSELDILDLRTCEAEITEGTCHRGMSGLLGLTARKPV